MLRKPAHIVVGLNHSRLAQAGLNHIRVNGSLDQIIHGANLLCLFFEYTDEFLTYDFTLCLRLFHALQPCIEPLLGIHTDKV